MLYTSNFTYEDNSNLTTEQVRQNVSIVENLSQKLSNLLIHEINEGKKKSTAK